MRLRAITIARYRNFVEPQRIEIEDDVTCLVGKNESGKTTVLKALHRLNPANNSDSEFNITTEYPRWRLAHDRRQQGNLSKSQPIVAEFELEPSDLKKLAGVFDKPLPPDTACFAARAYDNMFHVWLDAKTDVILAQVARDAALPDDDTATLLEAETLESARQLARNQARQLREDGVGLRAQAWDAIPSALDKYAFIRSRSLQQGQIDALSAMIPKFFYFSSYDMLPGECDLTALSEKLSQGTKPTDAERTVLALLAHAGETPNDFMDADYDSRKAELQAASADLSRRVFEYWKQNEDLDVIFDTDNVVQQWPNGSTSPHRILKIELRDGRHGGVETNFSTRSAGFQWFFSFFAAFSEYQESKEAIVVLLDEPGTSLHGEAQRDFVRFIFQELGSAKQTMYTTHSQHMVDPTRYEKLRAVHDPATRTDPNQGVIVTRANLSADRSTILPIESALGYSISQHLFLGSGHHLAVEGSSDFVYLQRMTEYLLTQGQLGLDPKLAIIPVGGVDNMPAFVALLGRRLKVSALVDGDRASTRLARIRAAARDNGVPEECIILCSDTDQSLPTNADIEDLFDTVDYLRLYNWAFGSSLSVSELPATSEPILRRVSARLGQYDHALPAHTLTARREEFFASVQPTTLERFKALFELLNATLTK